MAELPKDDVQHPDLPAFTTGEGERGDGVVQDSRTMWVWGVFGIPV
jgi:hypothetical protein